MTNLYPAGDITQTAGDIPSEPGAAPVGTLMQGNPQASQYEPGGAHVPGPQNTSSQLLGTQISTGNIPVHTHPNTVAAPPGVDSLLAQMSRGQVIMADSTYGQSGFIPANGGASPQGVQPAQNVSQPILARVASGVPIATPPIYTGN